MKNKKHKEMNIWRDNSGSALILVMVILISGTLIFSAITSISLLQRSANSKARSSTEAVQLADSCLEWSLKQYLDYGGMQSDPISDIGVINSSNIFEWDSSSSISSPVVVGTESYNIACEIYLIDNTGEIIDDDTKDISEISELRVIARAGLGEDATIRAVQVGVGFSCGSDIEYEGETYSTVEIGNQCWMAENLRVGDPVCTIGGDEDGDGDDATCSKDMDGNDPIEKYCYENNPDNCDDYGGLYQWDEMMQGDSEGGRGICPSDWHIPTHAEWDILESEFASSSVGAELHSGSCGFNWLLTGFRNSIGVFDNGFSVFRSSSEYDSDNAWIRAIDSTPDSIYRVSRPKDRGYSVRCIKD